MTDVVDSILGTDTVKTDDPTDGIVKTEVTTEKFDAAIAEADSILEALLSRIGDVTEQDPWLKLYVYGSPGAGKTTFAAGAPDWLLYNIERGGKVLRGHRGLIGPKCKSLTFTSTFQAKQIVKYLREGHPAFDQYSTFIVDSGSELQAKFNKELIQNAMKLDPNHPPTLMPDNGWNESTQFMKDFFDEIRSLDRHVIVTGHVKEETDKGTGRQLIRPNLTPKVTEAMAGIFDAVLYLERVENEDGSEYRQMRVAPVTKPTNIMAKTRISGLDPVLTEPTFNTLLDAYNSNTAE